MIKQDLMKQIEEKQKELNKLSEEFMALCIEYATEKHFR